MNKAKTVKEVLQAIKWLLDNVGWNKDTMFHSKDGSYLDPDYAQTNLHSIGSMCLTGALSIVETDRSVKYDARDFLRMDLNHPYGITGFNDQPGRTKKQIISALDRAIKKAK